MTKSGPTARLHWWEPGQRDISLTWSVLFEDFTEGDSAREWGLAAGLFILHYRRRHGIGPTFREVFEHLLPETQGAPSQSVEEWSQDDWYRAWRRFRLVVILAWSRMGYLNYEVNAPRSLRPGRRLVDLVRRDERIRSMAGEAPADEAPASHRAALAASLTPDQTAQRLSTSRSFVNRATRSGALHGVNMSPDLILYPAWQFSDDPRKPVVEGIPLIAAAIPAGWTLAMIHRFFATPRNGLKIRRQRQSPARWLKQGGDPTAVVIILETYSYDPC